MQWLARGVVALTSLICGLFLLVPAPVRAQASGVSPDAACLLCHRDTAAAVELSSGDLITAAVDPAIVQASVHGDATGGAVRCTDCHRNEARYRYPHLAPTAADFAEFAASVSDNCERCHAPSELHNPGHEGVENNPNLPTCVDCHGGHDVAPAAAMVAAPIATCQSCHGDFNDPAQQALHGEVVANFSAEQACQTCHNNEPLYPPDRNCKTCHTLVDGQLTLLSGETLSTHADLTSLAASVHGTPLSEQHGYSPLLCTDCHREEPYQHFPHELPPSEDLRTRALAAGAICEDCHADIAQHQADSVHADAVAVGNLEAATCVDCHGNHNIQPPDEPRVRVEKTCGTCHSTIQQQYEQSVHGAFLLGEDNPDVPVCTDCHGVHNIHDPLSTTFRLNSPEMCGDCHADKSMMAKYGISTDVFDTYVADFHGQTIELFRKTSPDAATNKAVCYDCHGIHDILPATDEHSHVIKANLLVTCQQCHPDATANFPDAWTSHFKPSLEHNTWVFLVDWFYRIIIPSLIGGFILFISTDVYRRYGKRGTRS